MYKLSKPVLLSKLDSNRGYLSFIDYLYSNGSIVRDSQGKRIRAIPSSNGSLEYFLMSGEKLIRGAIYDVVLMDRIITYMEKYYGNKITNCSAFAHYLTTGEFIECCHDDNFVVVGQGMRPFSVTSRVDVGDMMCIAYGKKKYFSSRRNIYRNKFIKSKKFRHDTSGFNNSIPVSAKSFEASDIQILCKNPCLQDYHFMVCIGVLNGEPVWISQRGYMDPDDGINIPLAITFGNFDPYPNSVPAFVFIKKRR